MVEKKEKSKNTKSRGALITLHNLKTIKVKDGEKITHEEMILDTEDGMKFKFFHKDSKKMERVVGGSDKDGKFYFIHTKDDKKSEKKDLSLAELMKELNKNKMLSFVANYLSSLKKTQKGGSSCSHKNCPYSKNSLYCPRANMSGGAKKKKPSRKSTSRKPAKKVIKKSKSKSKSRGRKQSGGMKKTISKKTKSKSKSRKTTSKSKSRKTKSKRTSRK